MNNYFPNRRFLFDHYVKNINFIFLKNHITDLNLNYLLTLSVSDNSVIQALQKTNIILAKEPNYFCDNLEHVHFNLKKIVNSTI